jgi:hypothetical protein
MEDGQGLADVRLAPASQPVCAWGSAEMKRREVSTNNASDNFATTAATPGPEASAWSTE